MRVVQAPIVAYRRVISPGAAATLQVRATCSAHRAPGALQEFGILRGLVLAMWRVLRCNPFSHGGYDPVDAQRLFSPPPSSLIS